MHNGIFNLSGRTSLVTGGSKGLGKAIARALAEAGSDVFICSRNEQELRDAAASIGEGLGVRVDWTLADLSNAAEAEALARTAAAKFGRIDILVNNAGSNIPELVESISDDAWARILELNLSSAMRLTRAFAGSMKARGWGRIIHISSVMGLASKEGRSAYSATKSALMGLARAGALELGPYGITVNCIAPGPFQTELPGKLLSDEEKAVFSERAALKRWGRVEEMAGPALLLASDAGSYITGTTLVVDGGVLARAL